MDLITGVIGGVGALGGLAVWGLSLLRKLKRARKECVEAYVAIQRLEASVRDLSPQAVSAVKEVREAIDAFRDIVVR